MQPTLEQSYRDCLALARRSGSNFYYSFLTLPEELFRETCVLYAYMRCTDDLGDNAGVDLSVRSQQLAQWRLRLHSALKGEPASGIFPALADVAARRHIPAKFLEEVISGVERDLVPESFPSFQELETYCYQVAGVVGECCIRIWGHSGSQASERAIDCGLAFQLTNILRDLPEDALRGRCYLPQEDLQRFGYTAGELCTHTMNDAFRNLMKFEVNRAREYYQRAERLHQNLSLPGRKIFRAMHRTYGSLLNEIERSNYDVFARRIALSPWRKWLIVGRAWLPGT